jgi:hypothetical protein
MVLDFGDDGVSLWNFREGVDDLICNLEELS